mmetsp:Transcript_420/g.1483  ORF Transcript_420/g.1483 Transcript_420/m.1483 type:complete len:213 (-) Transcript_420:2373-3011(-)
MLEVVFERPRLPDDCTFIFTDSTRETFGYNPATRQDLSKRTFVAWRFADSHAGFFSSSSSSSSSSLSSFTTTGTPPRGLGIPPPLLPVFSTVATFFFCFVVVVFFRCSFKNPASRKSFTNCVLCSAMPYKPFMLRKLSRQKSFSKFLPLFFASRHALYAFRIVKWSLKSLSLNCILASSASSRISSGERNGDREPSTAAIVSVGSKHPSTHP